MVFERDGSVVNQELGSAQGHESGCFRIPLVPTHQNAKSFVAGPQGEFLHLSPDDAEDCTVVEVDMHRSEQVRRWWPFLA